MPQDAVLLFFRSLGLIQIFILGWLIGASFAVLHNLPGLWRPQNGDIDHG